MCKAWAWTGALMALLLAGGTAERAEAATLTMTGTMDGTVDSTAFTDAAFTAVATFVGASLGGGGYSAFPSTLVFDISGVGTSLPLTNTFAVTIVPPMVPGFGTYGVELQAASLATVTEFFNSMATVSLPSGGQETLFSDPPASPAISFEQSGTFVLSLADGSTVTVGNFDSMGATAAVVSEPGTLGLLGVSLLATGLICRRPRRG